MSQCLNRRYSIDPRYWRFGIVWLVAIVLMMHGAAGAHAQNANDQKLIDALKQGEAFAIMRHAQAPGTGDPSNFKLEDCTTQRNLSQEGRDQARQLGARLKSAGIASAKVYTSAWCRVSETAELLGLGPVEKLKHLNSFIRDDDGGQQHIKEFDAWLKAVPLSPPLILVTHQTNLTSLTGAMPRSSEMFIVKRKSDGSFEVLGALSM